jgi:Flp pilus assembly pilin Flp
MEMRNAVKATFRSMLKVYVKSRAGRNGQTLVEYALILAIISVVCVGVIYNLGQKVGGVYSTITSVVASAQSSH